MTLSVLSELLRDYSSEFSTTPQPSCHKPMAAAAAPTTLRVEVDILQGRNLASKDRNGLSDPFVLAYVGGVQVHKTKVIPKTLNPSWRGESLVIARYKPGYGADVVLECWDHDALSEPEFMGRCTVPLNPPPPLGGIWLPLETRGVESERVTGDLQVAVRVAPVTVLCESWLWRRRKNSVRTRQRFFALFAPGILCCYRDDACVRERMRLDLVAHRPELRVSEIRLFLSIPKPSRSSSSSSSSSSAHRTELILRGPRGSIAHWTAALKPLASTVIPLEPSKKGKSQQQQQQVKSSLIGVSLEELAARGMFGPSKREVPLFLQRLIDEIYLRGTREPGVFRLSGRMDEIDAALARYEVDPATFLRPDESIHNVCGLLKLFIRSLPEPLLTFAACPSFIQAISATSPIHTHTLSRLVH